MKSLADTLAILVAAAKPLTSTESIPLLAAAGRYLAEDLHATINVPPADNSAMDGYAVRAEDIASGDTWLPITQTINAGSAPEPLAAGSAARIFTGAEIPSGADTVVMQENSERSTDGRQVKLAATQVGDNIRRCGQDIHQGQLIFATGHRLAAVDVAVIAAIGLPTITVFRRVRVAILATGNELVEPGQPLATGQIYNSNRYLLHTALTALGCEVIDLGTAEDTLAGTEAALRRGQEADLIITTGGVSVGEADFVKPAVTNLGTLESWKVAIKPGKPLAFGRIGETPLLGLPGNPVAVFITFLLAVKTFIRALNHNREPLPTRPFAAEFSTSKSSDRTNYLRVKITTEGQISRFGNQSSGVLSSVAWADGLAIIPAGATVQSGEPLQVILLNDYAFL
ncbi:gephyrin-like molybdotransferase Glp [Halioxenophilus sp. WMMB6]|uniref:molybdopterin molybdotransferase MoeA n=1 Tax=Halioxenophilus sp. WMMB6 TaxID=3073815 RepID=UPI00295EA5DE|nr:gephyrin-like molybdotransferase Glp [Halioxenophilus sp. WMMB6]